MLKIFRPPPGIPPPPMLLAMDRRPMKSTSRKSREGTCGSRVSSRLVSSRYLFRTQIKPFSVEKWVLGYGF